MIKSADIKLIVFDFDGVMTDNRVILSETGEESVIVNRADGWGVHMLKEAGYQMAILSTEKNKVVAARAEKLKIPVMQGADEKADVLRKYCDSLNIEMSSVMYVGNDVNDLAAMRIVGTKVVPSDAHPIVKAIADIQMQSPGGGGVVRELADLLLENYR